MNPEFEDHGQASSKKKKKEISFGVFLFRGAGLID
jgi:hypothetical protein